MSKSLEICQLPPNITELLALYLKPTKQWTVRDRQRAFVLVADWTDENHRAFAAFLRGGL